MVKKSRHAVNSEFPLLDELSLYASTTEGDGNCLFRALSDQVFGDESHHAEIRSNVVSYVEQHGDHFSAFVGEYGETFDQYVQRLYQDGVYGGHIEIVGFAEFYKRQIAVYQADSMYILEPQTLRPSEWAGTAHIAYHTWEHYSSVRPKAGPHSGPVEFAIPAAAGVVQGDRGETGSHDSAVPPWKVEIVLRSVPDAPEPQVIQMLQTKDLDTVIEELLMRQYEEDPSETTDEAPSHNALDVPSQSQTEDSDPKAQPASQAKPNKRQQAKDRRQEKKDRARRKKTGLTAQQGDAGRSGAAQASSVEDKSTVSKRIIHI